MSAFLSIPRDLLSAIIDLVADEDDHSALKNLAGLCLVSRLFNRIAMDKLYLLDVLISRKQERNPLALVYSATHGLLDVFRRSLDAGAEVKVFEGDPKIDEIVRGKTQHTATSCLPGLIPSMSWPSKEEWMATSRNWAVGTDTNDDNGFRLSETELDDVYNLLFSPYVPFQDMGRSSSSVFHLATLLGHNQIINLCIRRGVVPVDQPSNFECGCGRLRRELLLRTHSYHEGYVSHPLFTEVSERWDQVDGRRWKSPLHLSICSGQIITARLLVSEGASLRTDDEHETAIHQAAMLGQMRLLPFLVSRYANATQRTSEIARAVDARGATALRLALLTHQLECASFLADCGADIDSCVVGAIIHSLYPAAFWLLDRGASVNVRSKYNITPLHALFLAPITLDQQHQETLMKFRRRARFVLLERLLAAGADVHAKAELLSPGYGLLPPHRIENNILDLPPAPTPLELAEAFRDYDLIPIIRAATARGNTENDRSTKIGIETSHESS